MKQNNSDQYESIFVKIDEFQQPIAFKNKVEELIESGMEKIEAENFVRGTEFELELYYDKNAGLFGVDPEAVESGTVYNPYSGELMGEADEN